jgi:hypothetical protein
MGGTTFGKMLPEWDIGPDLIPIRSVRDYQNAFHKPLEARM